MNAVSTAAPVQERSLGRGYLWGGIGLCVLGLVAVAVQWMVLKQLFAPWYAPVLATVGLALVVCSLAQRRSVTRFIALVLIAALAGFQWYFLLVLSRLDPYNGPALVGEKFPAFQTTFADGRPFTDKNLQDGIPSVMVFFRGRW